jgi:DNA-directed RNA polymerase specialized sigma24 family protein
MRSFAQFDAVEQRRLQAWRLRCLGFTYREIASRLGITLKNAYRHVQTVRERFYGARAYPGERPPRRRRGLW